VRKKEEVAKIEKGEKRRRASISKVSTEAKDLEDQIAYQEQEIHRLQEKLRAAETPK
jgi:outer membrane murein-binding lipoprotein Lpp